MIKKIKVLLKKGVKIIFGIMACVMCFNAVQNCGGRSSSALFASAEENQIENIKSNNLIDFSKYITSRYGVTTEVKDKYDNGTISFYGVSEREWIQLCLVPISFENGFIFTLSQSMYFSTAEQAIYLGVNATNINTGVHQQIDHILGKEKLIVQIDNSQYTNYEIFIKFGVPIGATVDYTISFMCNEGDTPLPYEPNLQGVYETAYNSGLENGNNSAQKGFFNGATVNGYLKDYLTEQTTNFNFENIVINNGAISFYQFSNSLETIASNFWGVDYSDNWTNTILNINLAENVPLSNLELLGQGNSMSFSGSYKIKDTNGNLYNIEWLNDGVYKSNIPDILRSQNILINQITLSLPQGVDGLDITIYQSGLGYNAGYTNGYNDGKNDGYKTGNNIGYKNGYSAGTEYGQALGYEKAVEEGVSGTGILFGIFSFIKVFFTLMTNLMSVKIAGDMTIGLFIIGIPATGMIINWVIRLIQNLATGGNGGNGE